MASAFSSAFIVMPSELPGDTLTLIITTPWSSCGTSPVFVVFIKYTSSPTAQASAAHVIQRWWMKNMTPFLYLPITALNEAL